MKVLTGLPVSFLSTPPPKKLLFYTGIQPVDIILDLHVLVLRHLPYMSTIILKANSSVFFYFSKRIVVV